VAREDVGRSHRRLGSCRRARHRVRQVKLPVQAQRVLGVGAPVESWARSCFGAGVCRRPHSPYFGWRFRPLIFRAGLSGNTEVGQQDTSSRGLGFYRGKNVAA